jgi:hypothetical protein
LVAVTIRTRAGHCLEIGAGDQQAPGGHHHQSHGTAEIAAVDREQELHDQAGGRSDMHEAAQRKPQPGTQAKG